MTKKNKKVVWRLVIRRGQHPVIFNESCFVVLPNLVAKELGFDLHFYHWRRYEGATECSEDEYKKAVQIFLKKANVSPKYLSKILRRSNLYYQKLIIWAKKLSAQNFKKISIEVLQKQVRNFYCLYNLSCVYIYLPFIVEESLKTIFSETLIKKYQIKESQLESVLSRLTCLPRITDSLKERKNLISLTKEINQSKELRDTFLRFKGKNLIKRLEKLNIFSKIKKHQKKYAWLKSYIYLIRPYTILEIIENLQNILRNKKNPLTGYKKDQLNQKYLIKKLKIRGKFLKIIRINQEWVFYRQNRMEKLAQLHYNLKPFFNELARRYKLTYDELINLKLKELFSGYFRKSDIINRQRGYLSLLDKGHFKILTGKKFKEFLKKEKNNSKPRFKIIEGVVAQRGRARGRVRICTAYTFHNLKRGEILITGMTTPESVPYLKGCKAIITDEGGITCHAAIVSREMNIPCIIGTKIATQILKDGDLVEVDANKGIIKILSKQ